MVRWTSLNIHVSRRLTMPDTTLLDMPQEEQAQMLAALRRARYGYLLALHVLLLCAAGRSPTEIATFLFCSRSSISRIVRLYRTHKLGVTVEPDGQLAAPMRTTLLLPRLRRSWGALLKSTPRAYGWCRTRWSCATLAVELKANSIVVAPVKPMRSFVTSWASSSGRIQSPGSPVSLSSWITTVAQFIIELVASFRHRRTPAH